MPKAIKAALYLHRQNLVALRHMESAQQGLFAIRWAGGLSEEDGKLIEAMNRWLAARIAATENTVNNPPILETDAD